MVKVPANKYGFPFGSFIRASGPKGFVCRVVGKSDKNNTEIEAYGAAQEIGSCYTNGNTFFGTPGAVRITREEFAAEARRFGHDPTRSNDSRLRQWDDEQGTWKP